MAKVDIVEVIEQEESKKEGGSTFPKKNKKKKKTASSKPEAQSNKKVKEESTITTKDSLPQAVKDRMISCKERMSIQTAKVPEKDVMATSKTVYVHNIHDANPQVLYEQHIAILKDSRFVTAEINEADYEYLTKSKAKMNHHVTVVDCAVMPTLSYPFQLNRLSNGKFPTLEEIALVDAEFRKNPTNFHNPSLIIELLDKGSVDTDLDIELDDDDEEEIFLDDEDEFFL